MQEHDPTTQKKDDVPNVALMHLEMSNSRVSRLGLVQTTILTLMNGISAVRLEHHPNTLPYDNLIVGLTAVGLLSILLLLPAWERFHRPH